METIETKGKELWNKCCNVLAPIEKISPSEWAEKYRILPARSTAQSGLYCLDLTPYWREPLDQLANPDVNQLIFEKGAQLGYTTVIGNDIGWIVDNEPGPVLVVMPTDPMIKKFLQKDLNPLIDNCQQLIEHKPNVTNHLCSFDSCDIYFATANSPSSLASVPIRYVFLDEVDKYPRHAGKDANPVSLAIARTTTYQHRAKVVIGSTPTTRDNHIHELFESCTDKRYYHVPCPHCGTLQTLSFANVIAGVTIDDIPDRLKRADFIEQNHTAYYKCKECNGRIDDSHKFQMLLAGSWASTLPEGQKSTRIAYNISTLYSNFVSFSQIMAHHLRCITPGQIMEFVNQWLAEVWEDIDIKADSKDLEALLKTAPPALIVPDWAGVLTTAVDCQIDRYYLTVRAWGRQRSQLVTATVCLTLDEVYRIGLQTAYLYADGSPCLPQRLLIDSGGTGDMTKKVYEFARRDPRILPTKGQSQNQGKNIAHSTSFDGQTNIALLNTNYFKDVLSAYRKQGLWLINASTPPQYIKHLAAEHKIRKGDKLVWQQITKDTPNHFLDCEQQQIAASELCYVCTMPDEETMITMRKTGNNGKGTSIPTAPKRRTMVISGLYE